ncbi:MAG: glycine/sarcosine/betaine reductase complex component C subunit alpha [bacterium]
MSELSLTPNLKRMLAEGFLEAARLLETGEGGDRIRIGLTTLGSEHGIAEVVRGGELAQKANPRLEVILIGPPVESDLPQVHTDACAADAHRKMEELLDAGEIAAAVTMHYNFPVGVATVGKVITPAQGREMYLATTTGTAATDRVQAMIYNALYGIAVARATGVPEPTVGILNVDGSRQVERALNQLRERGFRIQPAESLRADGGCIMRGNDLLAGTPDVMVCDTLTGNLLMKVFSAYTTGGDYEASGYGYGPGVGPGYNRIINIVSRASGAPVIAASIAYAAEAARGKLPRVLAELWEAAEKAGLSSLALPAKTTPREVKVPPRKPVDQEISGIDVLELDNAAKALWQEGIYAETGMGCSGPVILVAAEDLEKSQELLKESGYL